MSPISESGHCTQGISPADSILNSYGGHEVSLQRTRCHANHLWMLRELLLLWVRKRLVQGVFLTFNLFILWNGPSFQIWSEVVLYSSLLCGGGVQIQPPEQPLDPNAKSSDHGKNHKPHDNKLCSNLTILLCPSKWIFQFHVKQEEVFECVRSGLSRWTVHFLNIIIGFNFYMFFVQLIRNEYYLKWIQK